MVMTMVLVSQNSVPARKNSILVRQNSVLVGLQLRRTIRFPDAIAYTMQLQTGAAGTGDIETVPLWRQHVHRLLGNN